MLTLIQIRLSRLSAAGLLSVLPAVSASAQENEAAPLPPTTVESATPAPPRPAPRTPAPTPRPVAPPEPEPIVIDDDAPVSYGEIETSTALFGQTPLIETPFSVGVIGQGIIQERRAFTAEDALLYEPSITLPYSGGSYSRADFSIRGFEPDQLQSYRIDGLPYVSSAEIPIDDKERIEVLKGPAGLRFGFVPPGGAINYIRKRPTPQVYRSVSTDIDTFGSFYSQIDVSDTLSLGGTPAYSPSGKSPWSKNPPAKAPIQAGPTLGYRLVIAGDEFDDFYKNAGGDRVFGSLFLEWKPNEDISVWTSLSGQNRERRNYGGVIVDFDGAILDTGVRTNTAQPWSHSRQEYLDFAIGADIRLDDSWMLRTSTSYGDVARSGYQSFPVGSTGIRGIFAEADFLFGTQTWETWSHHTHLEGEFHTGPLKHEVVIGGEYRSTKQSRPGFPPGGQAFSLIGFNDAFALQTFPLVSADPQGSAPYHEYTEASFFATDVVEFNDWLSVLGGVRYSELQAGLLPPGSPAPYSESVVSPTVAVMVEPVENLHGYVSYTRGMTQGGTAPLPALNVGEQLPPVESSQIEAGFKAELVEGRLYGEFSYFQIEQDLEYINGANLYVQDGLRVHEGFEFLLHGQVSETLRAGVSAMILDAVQENTGNPLLNGRTPPNVPDYKATAWVEWEVPRIEGLALSLNTVLVGDRSADNVGQVSMDSYCLLNAGARYRFQTDSGKQWTLRAYVENLTDERYFKVGQYGPSPFPGLLPIGQLDYGAPVNATFSVQVEF